MLREGLRSSWSYILDCVFPQSCLVCQTDDVFICESCRQNSVLTAPPPELYLTPPPVTPLIQVQALAYYEPEQVVACLIEALKYQYNASASAEIKLWLQHSRPVLHSLAEIDVIVPIPLHARRLAERGFNQAELIARALGKVIQKPVLSKVLTRTKATKQQAKLGRAARLTNVAEAFSCAQPQSVRGQCVLLVDDVYTTGSTMQSAAYTLANAQTKKVRGFVLACGQVR